MRHAALAVIVLAAISAWPACGAEPAVVVRPTNTETLHLCFRLASSALMNEQVVIFSAAEDVAAGEEPFYPFNHEPEEGAPSRRSILLGWEKALIGDQQARGLTAEQAAEEFGAYSEKLRPAIQDVIRGDPDERKEECRGLLVSREVDGKAIFETTVALDPAAFGAVTLGPAGRLIDDETLALCVGRAETRRWVVGAVFTGPESRFHRLMRERHPANYEQAVADAVLEVWMPALMGPLMVERIEDPEAHVAKFREHEAKLKARCDSYQ